MKVLAKRVSSEADIRELLEELKIEGDCVLIKPNWHTPNPGYFTDMRTLEPFLKVLPGQKIIVESYSQARSYGESEMPEDGGAEQKRWLRENHRLFMQRTGLGDLLRRYDCEFINMTEAFWAGETVPPEQISALVEAKYSPIAHKELYSYVPKRLFELKGIPLLSITKIRVFDQEVRGEKAPYFSLSMKNLFGLIPSPSKRAYHGSHEMGLSRSINDVVSIYSALFKVYGINEALYDNITEPLTDLGIAIGGDNLVNLDAFTIKALGHDPTTRHFLRIGSEIFGSIDYESLNNIPQEIRSAFRNALHGSNKYFLEERR